MFIFFYAFLFVASVSEISAGNSEVFAIIVSSSRYWFNYRHTSNALAIYKSLRNRNVSDDHILLYLAEQHACDSRNSMRAGRIVNGRDRSGLSDSDDSNVLLNDIEVDYSGLECSQESVIRAITGRHYANTPSNRRLPDSIGPSSSLLIYLTGHGGNGFLKFHDFEEMSYPELAAALFDARSKGRFGKALVIADTCQAESIGFGLGVNLHEEGDWHWWNGPWDTSSFLEGIFSDREGENYSEGGLFHVPGVVILASSVTGENSYAIQHDDDLGLSPSDGLTHELYKILLNQIKTLSSGGYFKRITNTFLKDLLDLSHRISSTINIHGKAYAPLFQKDSNQTNAFDTPLNSFLDFQGKVALMN
jgi:glycosylphosphatidylinositol transamidase (GPIT) subunit GPI8